MLRTGDQIRLLVSGLPKGKRESRLLMVIERYQAWVDDSGNEPNDKYFVLAGFVARADCWESFSDDWQAALKISPALDYFKMKEAAALNEQFSRRRGWDEGKRDERIELLTGIIQKYAALRIHASIKHAEFDQYIKSLPAISRTLATDHPYLYLAQQLILTTALYQDRLDVHEPCDFIFDKQLGFSAEMAEAWPNFEALVKAQTHRNIGRFLGSEPIYRDDKCFVPLQAADLYAWQIRKFHINSEKVLWAPMTKALLQLESIAYIPRDIRKPELVRLHKYLVEKGKEIATERPDVRLIPYAGKRGRQKMRALRKKASHSSGKGRPS